MFLLLLPVTLVAHWQMSDKDFQHNDDTEVILCLIKKNKLIFRLTDKSTLNDFIALEGNDIRIKFIADQNSEEIYFKYLLENFDKNWNIADHQSNIYYNNLDQGKYVLRVSVYSKTIPTEIDSASLNLKIPPSIWSQWGNILLVALTGLGLLLLYHFLFVRSKLNRQLSDEHNRFEAMNTTRKKVAQDFLDDFGNKLASIKVFLELVNIKLKNKDREVDHLLTKINENTNQLFNGTKDLVWCIDAENDNLQEVYIYIKDYAEELLRNTSIEFYASANFDDNHQFLLPVGWGNQLLLHFKKHFQKIINDESCKNVYLNLEANEQKFRLNLRSDGKKTNDDLDKNILISESFNNSLFLKIYNRTNFDISGELPGNKISKNSKSKLKI